jgi:virulence-associated protein VapD
MFEKDSTYLLAKKFMVYKLMGTNIFLNHALTGLQIAYRAMGLRLTNFLINRSVGSIFTSGETVSSLVADVNQLKAKNIESIGGYFVEGLKHYDEAKVQRFYNDLKDSITELTAEGQQGHVALRLTTMISLDVL